MNLSFNARLERLNIISFGILLALRYFHARELRSGYYRRRVRRHGHGPQRPQEWEALPAPRKAEHEQSQSILQLQFQWSSEPRSIHLEVSHSVCD